MSKQEESWEKLDSEFDHHLVDMKPYVLKLPHKSERQRCAMWIKKLCDPGASGSGLMARKNRNMYARLLLHMLRRGVLEGPFTHKPEGGPLKTLPTYMSIYFDEPLYGRSPDQSPGGLPDWVTSELSVGEDAWSPLRRERPSSPATSSHAHRRRHTYGEKLPSRARASSPDQTSDEHRRMVTSSDDSDLEARLNSWNLGIEKPRYLRERPIPLSPTDMKTKVLEARYQEERLKMQQKHDSDVQKILDRKNGEIEELKTLYRNKLKDSEETIRKLEKKVQSLVRESQVVRESKDQQIAELKKMLDDTSDSAKNEWEKKLHAAVAEMEQEKFELQKKHTENIQELLEDTNQRLAKMESEYSAQTQGTEQMVKELEARVKQLSVEVENGNVLRQKVTQEKAELEIQIASISSELQEANRMNFTLVREKAELAEQHEESIQKMQAKHNADMSHFQQEHALSAAKASDVIVDLEQCVAQLRQQVQDSEHKRQKQLREQESKFQQEKSDLQHASEKKVRSLQNELEKEKAEAKKRISKMEDLLREKEEQLELVRETHRVQSQQAESALEQFKKQVELSSSKAYSDMKQQMERVEADLVRSKALREKQAKEFSWQLEELKQKYEQQIVELKMQQEQERTHLFQHHNAEKDSLVRDHQREIDNLEKQSRAAMLQHETQTQEWRKRDAQSMAQLEAQVHSLREELLQAHAQRKQQLMELGLLREEERQRAAQEQEAALGRLRADMDRVRLDVERTLSAEKELAVEKVIADLQSSISSAKEEGRQLQLEGERRLQEASVRWDEERRRITRDADRANKKRPPFVVCSRVYKGCAGRSRAWRRQLGLRSAVVV
ncbi:hypothetical protein MATL_G00211900 [Megalops atlanticus]|uniref:DUF4485 domain-containing protein n=1 Tax=Megalops atlanticus TaxID=7932 RepID=A0A9D3PJM4_MEGAT|nr:hypothetical protein MATL_G00211900 [Megalops atlanticus]